MMKGWVVEEGILLGLTSPFAFHGSSSPSAAEAAAGRGFVCLKKMEESPKGRVCSSQTTVCVGQPGGVQHGGPGKHFGSFLGVVGIASWYL